MPSEGELKTLRISTPAFPGRDGIEEFREIFGRAILRIEMDMVDNTPFEADMVLRAIPDLAIATGQLSPMRNRHSSGLLDNDDLVLVIMRRGFGSIERSGHTSEVREGDVALTANGEPAVFTGHTRTQVINLRLSRDLLASNLANLGKSLSVPVIGDSPALQLLKGYADVLNDAPPLATPEFRRAVANHMHDLAALALGATREAAEIAKAEACGPRACTQSKPTLSKISAGAIFR